MLDREIRTCRRAGRLVSCSALAALWRRAGELAVDERPDLDAVTAALPGEHAEQAGLVVETVRGAIYYPRCGLAARFMSPVDPTLGRLTTIGAAFVAMSAGKPAA